MAYVIGKPSKKDWKSWYHTERWRRLRIRVLARDKYICQRTGELCSGRPPKPNSPVVNHKIPHRGNPDLFWDINNLETVTKAVHDGLIQREEKNNVKLGNETDGRPVDPNHPWNRHPVEEKGAKRLLEVGGKPSRYAHTRGKKNF